MSFNKIWDFFTYIFYKFTRIFKKDKRPEYTKVEDDDYEIEYGKLSDFDTPVYSFVIIRD